jgi:hypothetical protein
MLCPMTRKDGKIYVNILDNGEEVQQSSLIKIPIEEMYAFF